ncbi:hypothetical protein D3C74_356320 [compost metagenome]
MGRRRHAQLGLAVSSQSLKLAVGMKEMMVLRTQFTGNAQTDIFSSLIFGSSVCISEEVSMIRDITLNSLEAPDKVQMPHRFGIFPIRKNGQAIVNFFIDYSLDRIRFTLLIPLKVLVKRVLDIIAMFNLMFIF